MKPPICHLCHADFRSEYFHYRTGGALVQFADYESLREGTAGHPWGLECSVGIIFRPLGNWHPLPPTKR